MRGVLSQRYRARYEYMIYLALFVVGAGLLAYSFGRLAQVRETNRLDTRQSELGAVHGERIGGEPMPGGALLLSLVPENSLNKQIEGYVYDMSAGALSRIEHDTYASAAYHALSPNGLWASFVARDTASDGEYMVYRAVVHGDSLPRRADALGAVRDSAVSKRLPSVNDNGDIVYTSLGENPQVNAGDVSDINYWGVYLVRASSTDVAYIDDGLYPKWLDERRFVYTRRDGVYLRALGEATSTRIIAFNYRTYSNMKMSVSKSGRLLAWSKPDDGKLLIYNISDTSAPELMRTLDVHGFWSAFSPDDTLVAIQAVDWERIADKPNPRIEIYRIVDGELVYRVWLPGFIQTAMFLTDWVQ